jgi:hypothetical protein
MCFCWSPRGAPPLHLLNLHFFSHHATGGSTTGIIPPGIISAHRLPIPVAAASWPACTTGGPRSDVEWRGLVERASPVTRHPGPQAGGHLDQAKLHCGRSGSRVYGSIRNFRRGHHAPGVVHHSHRQHSCLVEPPHEPLGIFSLSSSPSLALTRILADFLHRTGRAGAGGWSYSGEAVGAVLHCHDNSPSCSTCEANLSPL